MIIENRNSIEVTQQALSGNYALCILYELSQGSKRYSELLHSLHITTGTLAKQLNTLEQYGLIQKDNPSGKKTEYSLTDIASDLIPIMDTLKNWGDRYILFYKFFQQMDDDFEEDE